MNKFLETRAAAQYLHGQLPGQDLKFWSLKLVNLRRKDRPRPFTLDFAKVEGKAGFYSEDDLNRYVEYEKARRTEKPRLTGRAAELTRAFGLGEADGGSYGRKLAYNIQLGFEEGDATRQFVRLMIERPLGVFRLDADEADALAKDLQETAAAIRRHAKEAPAGKPDLSAYETVTDNADMVVRRLKVPK